MTLPPSEWSSYPPLGALAGSVTLAYMLPDDLLLRPSIQDLSPFLKSVKRPLDQYWASKKDQLVDGANSGVTGMKFTKTQFELANHVFVCKDLPTETTSTSTRRRNVTICIGWKSIARHACLEEWDEMSTLKLPGVPRCFGRHELVYDRVLSNHSSKLIKSAGEDPKEFTVADMDKLDPYYVCRIQEPPACLVFSWRGAVSSLWLRLILNDSHHRLSCTTLSRTVTRCSLLLRTNLQRRPALLLLHSENRHACGRAIAVRIMGS